MAQVKVSRTSAPGTINAEAYDRSLQTLQVRIYGLGFTVLQPLNPKTPKPLNPEITKPLSPPCMKKSDTKPRFVHSRSQLSSGAQEAFRRV